MLSTRTIFFGFFITCLSLIGFGLFLEHVKGLEPCPLCMLQRVAYLTIALIALVAAIHNPGRLFHRIYSGLIILAALCGAGIATRQVWLQHLPPDQVPECGPGIEYMLGTFPFGEALKMILMGSGECAEVLWRFIGLSIPEWSLVCFIGLLTMGIVMLFKKIE
jgi:disulfide bond formation protein DsbB